VKDYHEEISISCIGTSSDILFELMEECRIQYLDLIQKKIVIFEPQDGEWKRTSLRAAREISTVIMDEKVKDSVLKDIKEFLDERTQRWYTARGILYKRGYLLHGPPGTGKSSFCRSIAGHFEMDIYTLSLSSLTDNALSKLFIELPPQCIVLLEDVDAVGLERNGAGQNQKDKSNFGVSLSGLLNVLDGVSSHEGRILMMSTNHLHELDEALIRPGRVDKQIFFKRADRDITAQLFRTIFQKIPNEHGQPGDVQGDEIERLAKAFAAQVPEEEFSPADVQSFLVQHKSSPADAVNGVQEWVANEKKGKKPKTELERKLVGKG
jgi:chaperone BCS1